MAHFLLLTPAAAALPLTKVVFSCPFPGIDPLSFLLLLLHLYNFMYRTFGYCPPDG